MFLLKALALALLFLDAAFQFGDAGVGGGEGFLQAQQNLVGRTDPFVLRQFAPAVAAQIDLRLFDHLAGVGEGKPVLLAKHPAGDFLDAGTDEVHGGGSGKREGRRVRGWAEGGRERGAGRERTHNIPSFAGRARAEDGRARRWRLAVDIAPPFSKSGGTNEDTGGVFVEG